MTLQRRLPLYHRCPCCGAAQGGASLGAIDPSTAARPGGARVLMVAWSKGKSLKLQSLLLCHCAAAAQQDSALLQRCCWLPRRCTPRRRRIVHCACNQGRPLQLRPFLLQKLAVVLLLQRPRYLGAAAPRRPAALERGVSKAYGF